ncbi:MAG: hypothetical protein H6Q19_1103 [Bacteroidetes bacterium]|nr:hypothetical protein [Bacteroidota bacterium]
MQLRGSYFSYNSLFQRFQNYSNLFTRSGVGSRESSRWSTGDINSEVSNYISGWITSRLNYLDNQYLGAPYVSSGVSNANATQLSFSPNPVRDMLTMSGLKAGDKLQLISVQGNILLQTTADNDYYVIDMSRFATGVYLIKVNNEIAKIIRQ